MEELRAAKEDAEKFSAAAGRARELLKEGDGIGVRVEGAAEALQVRRGCWCRCSSAAQVLLRRGPARLLAPVLGACQVAVLPHVVVARACLRPVWIAAAHGLAPPLPARAPPQEHSKLHCLCKKPLLEAQAMVTCTYCQVGWLADWLAGCGSGGAWPPPWVPPRVAGQQGRPLLRMSGAADIPQHSAHPSHRPAWDLSQASLPHVPPHPTPHTPHTHHR